MARRIQSIAQRQGRSDARWWSSRVDAATKSPAKAALVRRSSPRQIPASSRRCVVSSGESCVASALPSSRVCRRTQRPTSRPRSSVPAASSFTNSPPGPSLSTAVCTRDMVLFRLGVLARDHPVRSRWSRPTRPAPGFGPSPVYRASGIDPINLLSLCSDKDSIARPESQVNRQVAKFGGRTGGTPANTANLGPFMVTSALCVEASIRRASRDLEFPAASTPHGRGRRRARAPR